MSILYSVLQQKHDITGKIGSFQIGLSSEGTLSEKAFNSSKITKAKILFRPGEDLTQMLTGLTYQKIKTK